MMDGIDGKCVDGNCEIDGICCFCLESAAHMALTYTCESSPESDLASGLSAVPSFEDQEL